MTPGSLMLGNPGACFECGHQHTRGDRCLAFHFSPELFESIVSGIPGATRLVLGAPRLPPVPSVLGLLAAAQALRDGSGTPEEFRELALRLAGAVCTALNDTSPAPRAPSSRDERRVAAALRHIEARPGTRIPVEELAAAAAVSPFHFLRLFEQVVGVTPGQYMLRTRLRHAAMRLRRFSDAIAAVALDCGFEDVSTFNRQFRRATGLTPGAYRERRAPLR